MKPFTYFASNDDKKLVDLEKETVVDTDYNDPSLVGLNFYQQYGQHDDRPLRLSTTAAPTKVNYPPLQTYHNAKDKSHL